MPKLVQSGAVPVDRLEIGLRGRHLHVVVRRHIVGAIATDAEIETCRLDQGVDCRLDQSGVWRRRSHGEIVGQILALRHVEYRKALQERYRVCFVPSATAISGR